MIDDRTVLQRTPSVRFRRVDNEGVALEQRSAQVFGVNEVGARLLELLRSPRSIAELTAQVAVEYEVDHEMVRCEVREFLAELVAAGVLEVVPGTEPAASGAEDG